MRFETLRETLLKGGAAPRHVRRYIAELEDHLDDLIARQRAEGHDAAQALVRARALLGDDRELSAAMLEEPCFRALSFRAPWLVFGLFPVLASALLFTLPAALLVAVAHGWHFAHAAGGPPDWYRQLAAFITVASNLTLVPLICALFVAVALRQRQSLCWPALSTLAVLVLFVRMDVHFSALQARITIAMMPLFDAAARLTAMEQLPLLAAAWGAGLWWLRAARRGTSTFA